MGMVMSDDPRRQRRPQWEIDYSALNRKYNWFVKRGENAVKRGDRARAGHYYARARAAWVKRNAILAGHFKEQVEWSKEVARDEEQALRQGKVEEYRIEAAKSGVKHELEEARQYKEAIQALGKEVPPSAYRVNTQKLVPGKQIEVMGMRHAVDKFLGTTYDSDLKKITDDIGRKLKRGNSILLEIDQAFLSYCREKGKILRMKNPAKYKPPQALPKTWIADLQRTSKIWAAGIEKIERDRKENGLGADFVSYKKKKLREQILSESGRIDTDSLGLGSASMTAFGVKLAEYFDRKCIEIIPMDSPYSHQATKEIEREYAKLAGQLRQAEDQFENRDWRKIEGLREKVMQAYVKCQAVIIPFREKIWMRALQRAMADRNPPKIILMGQAHMPMMAKRINSAGYQAAYEWMPKIDVSARAAYRFDAERRRTKTERKTQKIRKETARPKRTRVPR